MNSRRSLFFLNGREIVHAEGSLGPRELQGHFIEWLSIRASYRMVQVRSGLERVGTPAIGSKGIFQDLSVLFWTLEGHGHNPRAFSGQAWDLLKTPGGERAGFWIHRNNFERFIKMTTPAARRFVGDDGKTYEIVTETEQSSSCKMVGVKKQCEFLPGKTFQTYRDVQDGTLYMERYETLPEYNDETVWVIYKLDANGKPIPGSRFFSESTKRFLKETEQSEKEGKQYETNMMVFAAVCCCVLLLVILYFVFFRNRDY